MSAVYGAVRDHNGAITVYSELGIGTSFKIYLPTENITVKSEPIADIESHKGNGTIMVVDDEDIIRTLAYELLSGLGYDVLTAVDGMDAIEIYSNNFNIIDLVILDMVMPKMNGKEAFDRLKIINPNVKVIFSSGFNPEGTINDVLDKGAVGFIQKPYSIIALSQLIKDHI